MARGCKADTARCHGATDYARLLPDCCREHVRELVRNVGTALTEAGVTWWMDYGTLLGAVRNPLTRWIDYPWLPQSKDPIPPGIVPHDKDADLGALASDYHRAVEVVKELRAEHHYNLMIREHRGSIKVRLSARNHTNVDIFFWEERPTDDGTEMYRKRYIHVDKFKGREFLKSMAFPLTEMEWEGMTLPAPREPAAFCEMRYGPNWMKPVQANHDGVQR